MSDNEKDQNDASNGNDHFFPNGRAIKSSEDIHDRFGAASGAPHAFEIMNAPGSVKAVGALLAAEFPRQVGRKSFKLGL